MKKLVLILSLLFLVFLGENQNSIAKANMEIPLTDTVITSQQITGTFAEDGTVEIMRGGLLQGSGEVVNNKFTVRFKTPISAGALVLNFKGPKSQNRSFTINYDPATLLYDINDKSKILKGKISVNSNIQAYVNGIPLTLKSLDNKTGNFEFLPDSHLKYQSIVQVISTKDSVKSIIYVNVKAAAPPGKPSVNPVSNRDILLTGKAEPNSNVYITYNNIKHFINSGTTGIFEYKFENGKPLREGTKISIYIVDRAGRSSGTAYLTVLDKIAPTKPMVSSVTDKSFSISGRTEAGTNVYILKNSKTFGIVKADSKGNFGLRLPLQARGTIFDLYAVDSGTNTSPKSRVVVSGRPRGGKVVLSAPLIRQLPELPRGCEVTSLTMMLNFAGVKTNKMALAASVKKDPSPYIYRNGRYYFGNPNYGFVGNMFTFSKPGFGVYNKPIAELANRYLPGRIANLSGQSFESVLNYVSAGHPVWVINTSWFNTVPNQYWRTWYTAQGPVRITMKEHSVLVTGYDSRYVYFNDPLDGQKNKKRLLSQFINGWKQYGSQAISFY